MLTTRVEVYALTVGIFVSAWGWGKGIVDRLGFKIDNKAVILAIGFLAIVTLVGYCAVFGFARPSVMIGIAGLGIAAAAWDFVASKSFRLSRPRPAQILVALAFGAIVAYIFETQFPSFILNFHDDFEKYLTLPKRLLDTGTLAPGTLNALGSETMGPGSVFQAYILLFFPMPFVNGADAGWGFTLVILLAVSAIPKSYRRPSIEIATIILTATLYLYYANTSPLYFPVGFLMCAILIEHSDVDTKNYAIIGAVCAAAILFKPTSILFALVYPTIRLIIGRKVNRHAILPRIAWLSTGGSVVIAPWFLLNSSNYRQAIEYGSQFPIHATELPEIIIRGIHPLFNQDSLPYIFIAVTTVAFPLAYWGKLSKNDLARSTEALIDTISSASIIFCCFVFLYFSPILNGYQSHWRYVVPIIGGLAFVAIPRYTALIASRATAGNRSSFLKWLPESALICAIALALPAAMATQRSVLTKGGGHFFLNKLSLGKTLSEYKDFNRTVLWTTEAEDRVRKAQESVPAGEPILCWLNTNCYLDFSRNTIYDTDPAGLNSPWATIPETRYVMWSRSGYGVRDLGTWEDRFDMNARREAKITMRSIQFLFWLKASLEQSDVLYDDGQLVVFKRVKQEANTSTPLTH